MKGIVNKWLAGALMVVAFSSCAEEKKGYVIDGQIAEVKDGMMYLKKSVGKTFVDVDSTCHKCPWNHPQKEGQLCTFKGIWQHWGLNNVKIEEK